MSSSLVQLVRDKALEFGHFTLASGKQASFYLDCRRLTLDSESINAVADALLDLMEPNYPDAIGGLELGAVPVTAVAPTTRRRRTTTARDSRTSFGTTWVRGIGVNRLSRRRNRLTAGLCAVPARAARRRRTR